MRRYLATCGSTWLLARYSLCSRLESGGVLGYGVDVLCVGAAETGKRDCYLCEAHKDMRKTHLQVARVWNTKKSVALT